MDKAAGILFLILIISSFSAPKPRKNNQYTIPDPDRSLVYIPACSFNYREADPLKIGDEFVTISVVTLKSFYASPYEVSNGQYLEFVTDIKKKGDTALYKTVLHDTILWRKTVHNEPFMEYYFRHPAYAAYPVVGVTHKQCEKYCEWLTEKYNQKEKRKFKKVKFRLPTKQEWFACADFTAPSKDKKKSAIISLENGTKIFPWSGPWTRNSQGDMLANFIRMNESTIVRKNDTIIDEQGNISIKHQYYSAYYLEQGINWGSYSFDITTPVKSYWPNEAGMYCLGGNVEEFVAEYGITKGGSWYDPGYYLRNEVIEAYDSTNEASCERGFRIAMDVIEK